MKKIILFFFIFLFSLNCFAAEIKISKILNLEDPWGSTFINNKELIVTEKFGKIILINIETGELSNIKHDRPNRYKWWRKMKILACENGIKNTP